MKSISQMILVLIAVIYSTTGFAAINLNVKIEKMVNNQLIEVSKNISSDYNKEIVIQDETLQGKIILTLRKIKNVLVNGAKIEPIQINLKAINLEKKSDAKIQTITSFYKKEAKFVVSSDSEVHNPMEVNLEFSEVN
jgi:hypothetical protein